MTAVIDFMLTNYDGPGKYVTIRSFTGVNRQEHVRAFLKVKSGEDADDLSMARVLREAVGTHRLMLLDGVPVSWVSCAPYEIGDVSEYNQMTKNEHGYFPLYYSDNFSFKIRELEVSINAHADAVMELINRVEPGAFRVLEPDEDVGASFGQYSVMMPDPATGVHHITHIVSTIMRSIPAVRQQVADHLTRRLQHRNVLVAVKL